MKCEYCGHEGSLGEDLEIRYDKVACHDTAACDEREAASHRAYIASLRKRSREGDELTEAEKLDLVDV